MSEQTWTVVDLLRWTTEHFAGLGIESPRLDAEVLLATTLGTGRLELYLHYDKPVTRAERSAFRELVVRRGGDRVPVSQLVGRREFWSLPLRVTGEVLTPRPETETLVETALELLPDVDAEVRVLDVGTGTGAIALAIARERPKARVVATDISPAALQIAAANADELQLNDRVRFLAGSLFEPVAGERFDLVASNPPYLVRGSVGLAPELAHEPEVALFAGDDGLEVLRPLVAGVSEVLEDRGKLVVEIDPSQADAVSALCESAGLVDVQIRRDLAQRPRVVAAWKAEA
ncbi:MAG: peptide chain release factor N(5)-glutamine methyltransferase [Proteobacteria bacterium]|nr:peptide chain release factor N(5)-glutamine methyltransferase [Pseudomonadota bacterium]